MITKLVRIDELHMDEAAICEAGRVLAGGGLVAFPTETVYGLGANGLDSEASSRIYEAKGRPSDNPLILHITSRRSFILWRLRFQRQLWPWQRPFGRGR